MRTISKARSEGERRAQDLLGRYPNLTLPVPVREIAVAEGCKVTAMLLEDDLSGMAFVKDGQKVIVYNAKHHGNRQRFTIAHELAHHLMHKLDGVHVDRGILRRDLTSATGIEPMEVQANAFAATLLMPAKLIAAFTAGGLDLENEQVVVDLARKFGVSTAAFTNRVLNLSNT